jgi:hypothetical protein
MEPFQKKVFLFFKKNTKNKAKKSKKRKTKQNKKTKKKQKNQNKKTKQQKKRNPKKGKWSMVECTAGRRKNRLCVWRSVLAAVRTINANRVLVCVARRSAAR